jgi:MFS family permease
MAMAKGFAEYSTAGSARENRMASTDTAREVRKITVSFGRRVVTSPHVCLAFLVVLMMFNILERSLLGLLAQPIKLELELSDLQIGILGGFAFALFYSVMGIPIAWISDRTNRVGLVTVCGLLWSVVTMLCGFAHNFWQLLLFRSGVGVGEAGYAPAAYSLISDSYPPEKRPIAIGIFGMSAPLGTMAGAAVGGWVAHTIGWRYSFILIGLASIPVALLFRAFVAEPPRGQFDKPGEDSKPVALRAALKILFGKSSYVHLVIGQTLLTFFGIGQAVWIAAFLMRNYNLHLAELGTIVGFTAGVGATAGSLLGGVLARSLTARNVAWYGWIQSCSVFLAMPIFVIGFLQPTWTAALPFLLIGSTCTQLCVPVTFGAIQNMVGSGMRGTSVAVLMFFGVLIGVGGGPVFVGWLSDKLGAIEFGNPDFISLCAHSVQSSCGRASALGLKYGLIASSAWGLLASLHFFLAARTMHRDLTHGPNLRKTV